MQVGPTPRAIVHAIIAEEAARAGVTTGDVLSASRERRATAARHAAIRRVRAAFPRKSTANLGRIFKRHHTTILHTVAAGRASGVTRASVAGRARASAERTLEQPRAALPVALDEPQPIGPPREIVADGCCRWISSDIGDVDWRMCGHPSVYGRSWCAHHLARALWKADCEDDSEDQRCSQTS